MKKLQDFATETKKAEEARRGEIRAKQQASTIHELEVENRLLATRLSVLERIDSIQVAAPKWMAPERKGKLHKGIPMLMLSDLHFDEVVKPDEVEGSNKYDRKIALLRLENTLHRTVGVARDYLQGIQYEGFTLFLGGDLLSGDIHEELKETNEDTAIGGVDFWSDQITAFIGGLADEFEKVHVVVVVGNHGRNSRKPRAKLRVRDNFDWLLARVVAKSMQGDSRVTWQIPESADIEVKVYETTFRLTHGDQFRGGSGISGMLSPLMLGHARKANRSIALGSHFDWLVMGHWHQYFTGKGLIVNGSLKGYDEYAYLSNFGWERPQQAFWVTTPENGVTFPIPILPENRKKEGW